MTSGRHADPSGTSPSVGESGSHTIEQEIEREVVRARLFRGRDSPRIGRFAVGERLGAGASSVVYAAWDEILARRVALKIFVASSTATRQQMQREARALARLSHRNVVAVFDAGEWNDHAFIAMELIVGTTLARWQAAPGRTTAEILAAYAQAGQGLAAAHAVGLVHRDFKPANVLVALDGRVVVTDFGLVGGVTAGDAAAPDDASRRGTPALVGTPAYMAPEQRRSAAPHPSADVYSFSLCLCEAVIARHPMRCDAAIWQRALARKVSRPIRAAICAGLAEDPAKRGAALDALLAAFEARRPQRGRRAAALVAAGLAACGLVAAASRRDAPRPQSPRASLPGARFHAATHRDLVRQVDAWRATLASSTGAHGAAVVRSLLLQPLPSERPCAWPAPIVSATLGDHDAVAMDTEGHVYACSLADGAMSVVPTAARCIVAGASGSIGVVDLAGIVRVVRRRDHGWAQIGAARMPDMPTAPVASRDCPIAWDIERDGAARIVAFKPRRAVNLTSGITVIVERTGLRVTPRDSASLIVPAPATLAPATLAVVELLDISRDGARVLVVPPHGPVRWLDVASLQWRQERLDLDTPTLRSARISPSGRRALVVDHFGRLEVLTLGGGQTSWLTAGPTVDATFRDDDTVVAIDADARIWQWDLASLRGGIAAIHDGWVWSIASDDQVTASASEAGTAIVVDRRTGAARLDARVASDLYKLVLDGERLVVGGDDGLHLWRWSDGAALPLADGRGIRIWDVEPATAGDGSRVYLAGALRAAAIYLWRDTSRDLLYRATRPNARINDIAVAPGGRHAAAVTSLGTLVLIDVAAQRVTATIAAHPLTWCRKVVFDTATAGIVTIGDDGYLRTWSASDGAPRRQLRVSTGALYGLDVQAGRAAIAAADGTVVLVDVATGQLVQRLRGHDTAALTVQLRADGQWLVSGDEAGRACLWRDGASECHTWLDGHTQGVIAARFADDGTIFTSGKDGLVRFWRPTYDASPDALRAELARHGSQK